MLLGGMSLSEEPISSQAQDQVSAVFSTSGDLPIETPSYYTVETKSLCWTIECENPLIWDFCPEPVDTC